MGLPIWKAGKMYRLEAVKDVHILDISWTLPCLRKDYLKKSEDYISHLIGHGKDNYIFWTNVGEDISFQLIINKEKSSVSNLSCSSYGSSFEIINFQREEEAYTTFSKIEVG